MFTIYGVPLSIHVRKVIVAAHSQIAPDVIGLFHQKERLRHIESRIAQIDAEGELSVDDVIMRSEPAQRLLSVRRVVPSFAAAIAHAQEFELDRIDVEMGSSSTATRARRSGSRTANS